MRSGLRIVALQPGAVYYQARQALPLFFSRAVATPTLKKRLREELLRQDMYAIVDIAGKQYRVAENERLYVPRQTAEVDSSLDFSNVLLVVKDKSVKVGTPTVKGASVTARVLGHVRADKLIVFKKKRRKRYRVKNGHRQPYTQIQIESITG